MTSPVKIKMTLATTYVGSKVTEVVEIDREEWDEMSSQQQEKLCDELYQEFVCDNNYGGLEVIE